jgi:CheY-like chemotaxis protein/HPt (histidine-containing phosphotransfer) domain-containing protein
LGMTELLLSTKLDPKQFIQAETIARSGNALLGIINDVLDFSKIEAGQLKLVEQPFDLGQLVDSVFDLFIVEAKKKKLQMKRSTQPKNSQLAFVGDAGLVRQILVNLVGNAVKFTHQGRVDVNVRVQDSDKAEKQVVLEVKDTGIGISSEVQEHIFQPFFQEDMDDSRQFGGSGLGLVIVKRLISIMGGKLWVESVFGNGSTFFVEMFLLSADGGVIKQVSANSALTNGFEKKIAGNPKVLVVDDNDVNADIAVAMLKGLGCDPNWVNSGSKALKQMKKQKYDLVYMDCHMPELDGCQTTERFRKWEEKDKGRSRLPIVALTAKVLEEEKGQCIASGMDDFLPKPINSEDLYQMTAKWMDSGSSKFLESAVFSSSPGVEMTAANSEQNLYPTLDQKVYAVLRRELGPSAAKLMQKFNKRLSTRMEEIQVAFDDKDLDGIQRAGHKLKGMGKQYGAMALAHLCQTLEDIAFEGQPKQMAKLLDDIKHEITRVEAAFNQLEL